MRFIFIILLFLTYSVKAATGYFVSSSTGLDANIGTQSLPFRTIAKVHSVVVAYDTIHLLSGDTWIEQIVPPVDHLTYNYYGTGAKPLITGLKTLTGLTSIGNIWSATASQSVAKQNTVLINGKIRAKARYPNTGYLIANSIVNINQIAIPHTTTDYTGAELVSTPQVWVIDVSKIRSKTNGTASDTLTLDSTRESGANNLYYFYQNKSSMLDTINEWSFDNTTKLFSVYATSQPTIEYSITDTLVNLHKKSNIILDGISFSGANIMAVHVDSARNDTIRNCTFNNNFSAIYGLFINGLAIVNDSIDNSLSEGYHTDVDTSLYVANNYFNHTGMFAGMGGNGYATYGHGYSYSYSTGATIRGNTFKNAGYHGLRFVGPNSLVEYNIIDSSLLTKNDGGGIYSFVSLGYAGLDAGSKVRYNYITNGIGTPYGNHTVGIYLDGDQNGTVVEGNTLVNAGKFSAIQSYGSSHIFRDNIVIDSISINVYTKTGSPTFKNNIFYNPNPLGSMFQLEDNVTNGNIDSNYYLMTSAPSRTFKPNGYMNLDGWKSYFPVYDIHSKDATQLHSGITSLTPLLVTNKSLTANEISINGSYYDARGNGYENSIYLLPFQSALLFPSRYKKPIPIQNLRFKY